nr:PREDICTED: uncharacterized protein LOC106704472 [Latimeria chalumnae]|eukprot:XP_014347056.1 PREDICTED: uncharacterized protein LOC106704472 [Latimeria chalumnae]
MVSDKLRKGEVRVPLKTLRDNLVGSLPGPAGESKLFSSGGKPQPVRILPDFRTINKNLISGKNQQATSKESNIELSKSMESRRGRGAPPQSNVLKEDKGMELPLLTSCSPTESCSNSSDFAHRIRVTFNPNVEDFRTNRRLSVPEEAFLIVPKSILKKRSSISSFCDLERIQGEMSYTQCPTTPRTLEERELFFPPISPKVNFIPLEGGFRSPSIRRSSLKSFFCSQEFACTLLELRNENQNLTGSESVLQ